MRSTWLEERIVCGALRREKDVKLDEAALRSWGSCTAPEGLRHKKWRPA